MKSISFIFIKFILTSFLIHQYIGHINTVALSHNGIYLATGSGDYLNNTKEYTVNLIKVESKRIVFKFDKIHSSNNNKNIG